MDPTVDACFDCKYCTDPRKTKHCNRRHGPHRALILLRRGDIQTPQTRGFPAGVFPRRRCGMSRERPSEKMDGSTFVERALLEVSRALGKQTLE